MSAKPRSDSKLASLPPAQKEALRTWLVEENLAYDAARDRLQQQFGIRTSTGALSRFYATECFALRSSEAKEIADRVANELSASGANFDAATIALVKQKAFERAYAKNGDVKELAILADIVAGSKKLSLKESELELQKQTLELKVRQYEDKITAARASLEKAKGKGGLTAETIAEIEQQLKLL